MIPYARQHITKQDIEATKKVLKSDWLTQGPMVRDFEKSVLKFTKSKFATAVNSATSALHLACLALEVRQGDWVWTSPNTFVSSANSGIYCGAKIDFVDIDPKTYNMCVNKLEEKLKKAKIQKKLPKVVIPVHFSGLPCDMLKIFELSKKYNFRIIEDASHAIGSEYNYLKKRKDLFTKVGSCKHSDVTVFSFHPVKIITTGEGGMALTNKKNLDFKLKLLRTHGITRDPKRMSTKPDGPWYYQQTHLGFNYRMNDIEAALGKQQMLRIKKYISKRNNIAKRYDYALKNLPLNLPYKSKNTVSSYHLYVITLKKSFSKKDHSSIFKQLKKKGIGVNLHYIPVHTHPYYLKKGFKRGDFPIAEEYYKRAISLPMYPKLSIKEQNFVIKSLKECIK
tara:strand:- start:2585 stop:3766 length:1182 start_codon:yes stop_codon:yes gene_type:complete